MSFSNLNSLQDTIQNLKQIVDRNQGVNHESSILVKQMELLVAEIERKANLTRKTTGETAVAVPLNQTMQISV